MALQFRRGTSSDRSDVNFVPSIAEPIYETDTNHFYIGDGVTAGGIKIGGNDFLSDVGDVTFTTNAILNPSNYSITSQVATISFAVAHGITDGNTITISNSSVAILDGTHTATVTSGTSITIPVTGAADVTTTTLVADIVESIPDGASIRWDSFTENWEDYLPNLDSLTDVDLTTTAPVAGDLLSFDGTNFVPGISANLNLGSYYIVSSSNGDIEFAPDGTGATTFRGNATGGSGKIKLNCEQNSHGVTIQGPPHSAAATYTLTLPNNTGNASEVLTTDGSGTLTWSTGGPGLASRTTASGTSSSISNGASATFGITGFKSYMLLSIETDYAAWVTLYTSSAARTADASRTINTDPLPGSGVIAEVITAGATTQKITPGLLGFNDESTPTTEIFVKVENQSGSTVPITVTLTLLELEV